MTFNVKTLFFVALLVCVGILFYHNKIKQKKLDKLTHMCFSLKNGYNNAPLDRNIKTQMVIRKNKIVLKQRKELNFKKNNRDQISKELSSKEPSSKELCSKDLATQNKVLKFNQENIKTSVKYMPPEGKTEVSVNLKGNTKLKIQTVGFCVYPCLTTTLSLERNSAQRSLSPLSLALKFNVGIATRVVYWNRYGLGVGVCMFELFPFVFIDRRICDFVAFIHNTAIGVVYNGNLAVCVNVFF